MTWRHALARRAQRAPLGAKLGVLSALLTALVVVGAFLVLSVHIRANTKRLLEQELSRNQRTLIKLQRVNLQHLVAAASLLAQSPSIRSAVPEPNTDAADRRQLAATADDVLRKLLPTVDEDLVLVTDAEGRVFASATARGATAPPRAMNLSRLPAVRRAVDPSAPADRGELAVLSENGVIFQVAVHPLVLDGFTLGSLVLGNRLDSGFVASARAAFDGEILLIAGDTVLAGSLPGLARKTVAGLRGGDGSDVAHPTMALAGEEYVIAPLVLGHLPTGASVRLWLLAPLTRAVRQLTRPLLYDFLFYGTLAVIIAAIGAAFVARSVLRPLERFVRYLRSGVATERLDHPFEATHSAAEVRALNESFTQLMRSIAGKQHQLELQATELSAANLVLTEEIRARGRVEDALRDSEAQLRHSQKMEAIGTLAGGIAHDFNNLLTVIAGYSRIAFMDAQADGRSATANDLRQVIDAAERAAKLTEQLLAFSRKQVLQPTVLDLGEVVASIAPMFRRVIGEHIDLRVVRGDDLARIVADRGQLEQVLMNLIVNARDAMPSGGVITVTTANTTTATMPTAQRADAPVAVSLSVADTGVGMTQAVGDRAFEPFFTTKEVGKGTGLGLSTVYGIVTQSGGTITVDSAVGAGSTFTMTFPAVPERAATTPIGDDEADVTGGTETILLVEDEEPVRELARRALEERGYEVLAVPSSVDALVVATSAHIDAILTDVVMPELSGPQLVAHLSASGHTPVVVYMSGYADDALLRFELDPEMVFLRKPFTPTALARAVREALDTRTRAQGEMIGVD